MLSSLLPQQWSSKGAHLAFHMGAGDPSTGLHRKLFPDRILSSSQTAFLHRGGGRAGEMVQRLRACTDLAEDLGSVPCTKSGDSQLPVTLAAGHQLPSFGL